jgi:uncharacterized protein involved in cysteine biosynthesis
MGVFSLLPVARSTIVLLILSLIEFTGTSVEFLMFCIRSIFLKLLEFQKYFPVEFKVDFRS